MIPRRCVQYALAFILLLSMQVKANETLSQLPVDDHWQMKMGQWITSKTNSAADAKATAGNCTPCVCGVANRNPGIVGGYEAKYPWIAALKYEGQSYCGGALISDLYVLTNARCVKGFPTESLHVSLMNHNQTEMIDREVESVVIHEEWSIFTYDYDIALIKLSERVEPSSSIKPVCMPSPGADYAGEQAYVLGWGLTNGTAYFTAKLQEIQAPILAQQNCRASKSGPFSITENMMCVGGEEGAKKACLGDSCSPMLIYMADSNTFHVAGIVSWGESFFKPQLPGVYTRVNKYLSWIEQNTGDSCKCHVPANKIEPEEIKR